MCWDFVSDVSSILKYCNTSERCYAYSAHSLRWFNHFNLTVIMQKDIFFSHIFSCHTIPHLTIFVCSRGSKPAQLMSSNVIKSMLDKSQIEVYCWEIWFVVQSLINKKTTHYFIWYLIYSTMKLNKCWFKSLTYIHIAVFLYNNKINHLNVYLTALLYSRSGIFTEMNSV